MCVLPWCWLVLILNTSIKPSTWVSFFKASRQFKCSFDQAKIKFYRTFNAMCYRAKNASSELVCVQLLKSKTDVAQLDHALDRAVFRIFGCSSSADITYIREAVDISGVTGYVACRYRNFQGRYFTCFSWSPMVLNCVSC